MTAEQYPSWVMGLLYLARAYDRRHVGATAERTIIETARYAQNEQEAWRKLEDLHRSMTEYMGGSIYR